MGSFKPAGSSVVRFEQALEIVRTHADSLQPPASELTELARAMGRVLARDLAADRDQPPFDRSTRDGFAVQAADWSAGRALRVVGQLRAGEAWQGGPVGPGTAVEIMTGAPVPSGADGVAMIEHAEVLPDGTIRAASGRTLAGGENIVPRGAEASFGQVILPAGTWLEAAEVAIAASCGLAQVPVYRRAAVAIIATGDELVELHETPAAHQIRNSNSYAIAALAEAAGARPVRLEIARDRRHEIRGRIEQACRASDLVVLSGGVSAGRYDLVEEVLSESGAEFLFTGVAMQPGKPVVFGRLPAPESAERVGSKKWLYFFGLPGNPVSTQVTFQCFVEPFLRTLSGEPWPGPRFAQATLAEDVAAKAGLTRVLPARRISNVVRSEVRLVGWQGSGDLAANTRANCYAVLPDGIALKAGDPITILLR